MILDVFQACLQFDKILLKIKQTKLKSLLYFGRTFTGVRLSNSGWSPWMIIIEVLTLLTVYTLSVMRTITLAMDLEINKEIIIYRSQIIIYVHARKFARHGYSIF
jgi:hypothetical protein